MLQNGKYHNEEARWSAWMASANSGNEDAYRLLLTELGSAIETFIRMRFGRVHFLEDCVQECLIAVHNARHTYDPARAFGPWMITIVKHKTIDILRRSNRLAQRELPLPSTDLVPEVMAGEHVHEMIDGIRILERLAPDHREAVVLTHYAGLTIPEAARQIGISDSALKARLRRGLIAIKKQLDAEDRFS